MTLFLSLAGLWFLGAITTSCLVAYFGAKFDSDGEDNGAAVFWLSLLWPLVLIASFIFLPAMFFESLGKKHSAEAEDKKAEKERKAEEKRIEKELKLAEKQERINKINAEKERINNAKDMI